MKTISLLFLVVFVIAGCSSATQEPLTTAQEPTNSPQPTAAATESTATEQPPEPTATNTLEPTPSEIPTETALPPLFSFTVFENNPILKSGDNGEWDYFNLFGGRVVLVDDTFHLFYGGRGEGISGIGYATSTDGFSFTKYAANPIFQPDGEGFDAVAVRLPVPLESDDVWMLFYNASSEGESPNAYVAGSSIGLTTAPAPAGPWSQGQLVLKTGRTGEWDEGFVLPNSVIGTEDGYRMYYTGGINPERIYSREPDNEVSGAMCGMATSTDGINWTKYDDPSTTEAPFAESDPILKPSSSGWDSADVECSVFTSDDGFEMLYRGLDFESYNAVTDYGFASSSDGVNWVKYPGNPVYRSDQDPQAIGYFKGGNEGGDRDSATAPSVLKNGSTYYLYYSYWIQTMESVVTGEISEP